MNILITSAEWKSALTCMRSLAKKGHRISLLSEEKYTPSLYSKFCKERIISPKEKDKEAYLKFLVSIIETKKYDLLIPISDFCVEYFIETEQELSKYVKILLPPKEAVDKALHKDKTYRFALQNGIPIPDTYFPQTMSEVKIIAKEIKYPCVVKKSKGCGGGGITYVDSDESLILFFSKLNENKDDWPMVQEFIKSHSASLLAVCQQGEILDFFMYQRIRQYPEKKGVTVFARSIFDQKAFEVSKLLIKKILWHGSMSIDFFITKDGDFLLTEINPRFSAVTQFAYACGVDLPLRYLELILGKKCINHQRRYKTGVYYRSIFPEEIDSCINDKKYIFNFIINFLRPNTCYDFSFTDPALLIMQMKNAKWSIFRQYKKIKNLNNANKGISLKSKNEVIPSVLHEITKIRN